MTKQKRVAAIHDISGIGKCSLTVALPIISAAGIETAVMPTAVLSTHTGGFTDFTYRDLTMDLKPFSKHWSSLGIKFDAIYSGFLGSYEQLNIVSEIFKELKDENTLIIVDPVMADNGRMYTVFDETFADGMRKLCENADIITPNITEACFMLGIEYKQPPYDREYIENLIKMTGKIGAKKVVLTGVSFDEKTLGAACYDSETGETNYAFSEKMEGIYHGTGDVFASALVAGILSGKSLSESADIAVKFTSDSIRRTKDAKTDVRFGVNFEEGIPDLMRALGKI